MERLPDLSERLYRIKLARHVGVAPDWFDNQHPAWEDAADISLMLEQKLKQGPEVETWKAGQRGHGQAPIVH